MSGTLQADELGNIFQILSEYKLIAARNHGHVAHAVGKQFLFATGIVEYVDCDEVDIFFRKKLFRSETAASAGLRKEYEFVGDVVHERINFASGV
jgi:hypothetical protein